MKEETLSEGVQERLEIFRACEQDLSALESKIESSLKTKERLKSEVDELDWSRASSADDRKAIADRFAAGEVNEAEVLKVRKRYAVLSDQLDAKEELRAAVDRALTDAQGRLNDAKTKLSNAKRNVIWEYRAQLQQEICEQCGDKLQRAWAAWLTSSGHGGVNGIGSFAANLLLIEDQGGHTRLPNHEDLDQLRFEVCSTLGLVDE